MNSYMNYLYVISSCNHLLVFKFSSWASILNSSCSCSSYVSRRGWASSGLAPESLANNLRKLPYCPACHQQMPEWQLELGPS